MTESSPGTTRLADVTLAELRRSPVTVALLLTVLYLFLGMVGSVFVAGVLDPGARLAESVTLSR